MMQLDTQENDGSLIHKKLDNLCKKHPYYSLALTNAMRKHIIERDVDLFHQMYQHLQNYKRIAIVSNEFFFPWRWLLLKYFDIEPTVYSNHIVTDLLPSSYNTNTMFENIDLSVFDLVIIPDFEHFAPIDMMKSNYDTNLLVVNWLFYDYKVNNNLALSVEDLKEIACVPNPIASGRHRMALNATKYVYYLLGRVVY